MSETPRALSDIKPVNKPPRSVACQRCRRRKKKCDHVKPICGECRKTGSECLPLGSQKHGRFVTVPVSYLEELEARVAELEAAQLLHIDQIRPQECPNQECQSEFITSHYDCNTARPLLDEVQQHQGQPIDPLPPSDILQDPPKVDTSLLSGQSPLVLSQYVPEDLYTYNQLPFAAPHPKPLYFDKGLKSLFQAGDDVFASIATGSSSPWLPEFYSNVFFSNVQPQWAFLNEKTWREWFHNWHEDGPIRDRWQGFFLEMVYAVGALLCSAFDKDSPHPRRAKAYYKHAVMTYSAAAMNLQSSVLRTQACLLLSIYAIHGPSSDDIYGALSQAMLHCATTLTEYQSKKQISNGHCDHFEAEEMALQRKTFMTCHIMNEIVVSGWDRPNSATYERLDDALFQYSNRMPSSQSTSAAFEHLFQLRRLQARARKCLEQQESEFSSDLDPNWKEHLKAELDTWRRNIPLVADASAPSGYLRPQWMEKLYDYSIFMVLQGIFAPKAIQDLYTLLAAASEACRTFRVFQEMEQMMCLTWSALVWQYRSGILILFCYWATPAILRTDLYNDPHTFDAIDAVSTTLAQFAHRWEDALVYSETFDLLRSHVPLHASPGDEFWVMPATKLPQIQFLMGQLRARHAHKSVLALIEEMAYKPRPQEDEALDLPSDLTFDMLDMFDFDQTQPNFETAATSG